MSGILFFIFASCHSLSIWKLCCRKKKKTLQFDTLFTCTVIFYLLFHIITGHPTMAGPMPRMNHPRLPMNPVSNTNYYQNGKKKKKMPSFHEFLVTLYLKIFVILDWELARQLADFFISKTGKRLVLVYILWREC